MFTEFYDMHSGGSRKTDYDLIVIEADSEEAAADLFEEIYNRDPYNITCECCGRDYSIYTADALDSLIHYKPEVTGTETYTTCKTHFKGD